MNKIELPGVAAQKPANAAAERGLDLREILQIIWSARWGLLFCAFLGAAIAFILAKQITPKYRADASIMLDFRQQNVIDIESVLSEVPLNRQFLESELLILQSDTLLERVVDKLRLDLDPEYNPSLALPSEMDQLIEEKISELRDFLGVDEWLAMLNDDTDAASDDAPAEIVPLSFEAEAAAQRRRAVRILRGQLRARQLAPAYAISVQITSEDAMKAALIANTVADQYVVDQLEAKFQAARRATTWLTGRLEELRARVATSEGAVQVYTNEFQTGDSQGASITRQQIAQLNAELINARAEVAQSEARFRQAEDMVRKLGPANAATALSSNLLIALRQQQAVLKRREAELSNRYGPKHPTMIELRTEVSDIEAAIAGEVRQIVTGLQNDVQIARARQVTLTTGLSELEVQAGGQSEATVGLRQLEAEADADRRIYNDFLQRLNETREQEGFQTSDSRIIEPASPPFAPFVPRAKVSAGLGGIAGGAFGLGLLALLRLLNRTFRTFSSITDQTGVPVLAGIPRMSRRHRRKMLRYLNRRPNSDLAESARYLRNALILESGSQIRSALITSSFPKEGKSTLSVLLAEMLARMGKSVILLDGDLRRPSLAPSLSIKPTQDLVSILVDDVPLEDVVITPEFGSFHLIPTRAGQAQHADVLASTKFVRFFASLEKTYDFVLIDGPPVLGVGDFSVFGKLVDTSIVVAQWDKTPIASFERMLSWLADHQMKVSGAVLSQVDRRREAKYDTTTYGAEYTSFRRYYTN